MRTVRWGGSVYTDTKFSWEKQEFYFNKPVKYTYIHMRQSSTLKELSEILGISVSTVSRALKKHPDISSDTRQRVQDLANLMEYEPNNYAVSLRSNQSRIFGIIVPAFDNFINAPFIAAIEEEASLLEYSLLIMQSGDTVDKESNCISLFRKNRIAGLFIAITPETIDLTPFLRLVELNIPVIFFDRVPEFEACNKICFNDGNVAKIAAEAIITKKKKKILAIFNHPNLSTTKQRWKSFKETFAGQSPETLIDAAFVLNADEARKITFASLTSQTPPEAIFCMDDVILTGVINAIHETGLSAEEEQSIVAISNGLIPTMYKPAITYVETSGYKLGKLAFTRMMECLSGKTFVRKLFVESQLVEAYYEYVPG